MTFVTSCDNAAAAAMCGGGCLDGGCLGGSGGCLGGVGRSGGGGVFGVGGPDDRVDVSDGMCMSAGFSCASDVVFLLLAVTVTYSDSSALPVLIKLLVLRQIVIY